MDQDLLTGLVVADTQLTGADSQNGGAHGGGLARSALHFHSLLDS